MRFGQVSVFQAEERTETEREHGLAQSVYFPQLEIYNSQQSFLGRLKVKCDFKQTT